jgi:hypothetical protein
MVISPSTLTSTSRRVVTYQINRRKYFTAASENQGARERAFFFTGPPLLLQDYIIGAPRIASQTEKSRGAGLRNLNDPHVPFHPASMRGMVFCMHFHAVKYHYITIS